MHLICEVNIKLHDEDINRGNIIHVEIKLYIKIIFYFFEADQTLFFSKCKQEYPEMLGLFKILGTQFCLFCKKFSQNFICIECFAC